MLGILWKFSACTVVTGWLLYVPVYDGYSSFSPLILLLPLGKLLFNYLPRLIEFFGIEKRYETARKLYEFIQNLPANKTNVAFMDTIFNGVNVRVYWPVKFDKTYNEKLPGLMFFHGGGCVFGSVRSYDHEVKQMVEDLNVVMISVDYRLAPEHVFPAALDDCLAATKHLFENSDVYGVDSTRIALMGGSAGGGLVAAVSQLLTEQFSSSGSHFRVKLQILVYPLLQLVDLNTPSYQQNSNDAIASRESIAYYMSLYAFGNDELKDAIALNKHTSSAFKKQIANGPLDHSILPARFRSANYVEPDLEFGDDEIWSRIEGIMSNPAFAPLLATDLRGLPTSLILTCQFDVLRDDGIIYAKRLEKAGVTVSHIHVDKGFHGILGYANYLNEARETWKLLMSHIYNMLHK